MWKPQGCAISHNRVIRENVPQKITEFSMERHVGAPSDGHQHGGRKPAKTSGVYLGYFKAFLLSAELSHIDIDAFYYMLADQTSKKNTRQVDVFMYVTCLEQQSFCHALRKNLKFKLLYFQNKECYPVENKQADGNLYFLLCDEDKNPKLCLVMNFSFLFSHVKTKNSLTSSIYCPRFALWFYHVVRCIRHCCAL